MRNARGIARLLGIAEAEALELPEGEEWDCVALALATVLETSVDVSLIIGAVRVVDCPVTKPAIKSSKVMISIILPVETQ